MKKILLAIDGSETSLKALEKAIEIAKVFDSKVVIMSVVYEQPIYPMPGAIIPPDLAETRKETLNILLDSTRKMTKHLKEKFTQNKVETREVVGRPSDEILKEVNSGDYDLVILGSRGLTGVKRVLLGTVSGKVANNSEVSVLIVK
ncbi:nucleotide-binding universal stress UspA family protein [Desulfitispora alkaliphila]|uniref:universal stress protein n=1 Tax=Desulfitispora alkaliphila TaxID=622674 RepID=UPI003D20A951